MSALIERTNTFSEEKQGWKGWVSCMSMHLASDIIRTRYIEWEKYPEKKAIAEEVLKSQKFSFPPGLSCFIFP